MTFTQEAWARNSALFQATLEMPFNRELADGTLSIERFRHYMIQDAHYLVGFGRALAVAAARADDSDTVVQLAAAAQEAVVGERELHNGFLHEAARRHARAVCRHAAVTHGRALHQLPAGHGLG